jgi:hypothetical protein
MGQEVPKMDGDAPFGVQGPEICLLARRLVRVIRPRTHDGGEIPDVLDLVFGKQVVAQQRGVEPFGRCAFEASVVEIEAVDIDARSHPPP